MDCRHPLSSVALMAPLLLPPRPPSEVLAEPPSPPLYIPPSPSPSIFSSQFIRFFFSFLLILRIISESILVSFSILPHPTPHLPNELVGQKRGENADPGRIKRGFVCLSTGQIRNVEMFPERACVVVPFLNSFPVEPLRKCPCRAGFIKMHTPPPPQTPLYAPFCPLQDLRMHPEMNHPRGSSPDRSLTFSAFGSLM